MKIWKVRLKRRKNPHVNVTLFAEATKIHTAIARAIRDVNEDLDISDGIVAHAVEYDNNKYMDRFYTDNPGLRDYCIHDGTILEPEEPEVQYTLDGLNNLVEVKDDVPTDSTNRKKASLPMGRRKR